MLEAEGTLSQVELAEKLRIRPQSLTEILFRAEREGLLDRRRGADKRSMLVSLTAEGAERAAKLRTDCRAAAQTFLAPLSDEEKETLRRILEKIAP